MKTLFITLILLFIGNAAQAGVKYRCFGAEQTSGEELLLIRARSNSDFQVTLPREHQGRSMQARLVSKTDSLLKFELSSVTSSSVRYVLLVPETIYEAPQSLTARTAFENQRGQLSQVEEYRCRVDGSGYGL